MLSVFPELLSLSLLAPFLLRLTIGFFFLHEGWILLHVTKEERNNPEDASESSQKHSSYRLWALLELLVGVLLFIGLYTQIATLLSAALCMSLIYKRTTHPQLAPRESLVYLLALIISLTLLVLGPGILGFDLPL